MNRETELQSAITKKCMECSGGMRNEVTRCPVKGCALYQYRPYQTERATSSDRLRRSPSPEGKALEHQIDVYEVLEAMA